MGPRTPSVQTSSQARPIQRIRWWYGLLVLVGAVFVIRAFYLQVIRHDYYKKAALNIQLKQYQVPAQRGVINAHSDDRVVPLVLNETLFTLFADPSYVKDPRAAAQSISGIIGGKADDVEKLIRTPDTRYVVLAKKLSRDQKTKLDALKLKGIGTRDATYRTYPNGQLASQVLGFVNEDGEGKYGIEQALNAALGGTPGELRAITDAQGVPLPANKDNIVKAPVDGEQITLTIDVGLQQRLEDSLKTRVESGKALSGSAIILDANSGAVRAMANYPTYNPAQYGSVKDAAAFNNDAVSAPLEVGSIMKALTVASALDQGVVSRNTSYYDPSFFKVDEATIKNVEEDGGAGTKNIQDILQLSLNTGATWLLMQMGGGEINAKARNAWHEYMVDHYRLGEPTNVEQGYENPGYIPDPQKGFGLDITYANTAFGQGMSATPLQMGAAFAAVMNGGTYYQPHLIESVTDAEGNTSPTTPKIQKTGVVKSSVSEAMQEMLEYTFRTNRRVYTDLNFSDAYSVGGKTGTAQITKPGGGYYDDKFNGTYLGFVGGDRPQYIVVVRISEPHVPGYAGAKAAAPLFAELANILINNYNVTPKS